MPGRGMGKSGEVGGGEEGKKDSARVLALSVLDKAFAHIPSVEVLRIGMQMLEKSEGVLTTYLLAL